jgi:hypothetical protein
MAPQCEIRKVANTVSPWWIEGYDIVDSDPCDHMLQLRELETQGGSEALWSNEEVGGRGV